MRPTFIIAAAASVAALLTGAGPAQAQNNRSFVSGQGSDTNPCSLSEPCRSFTQALSQTNPGGEISVLDSAGYGTLTIDKSISIVNPGGVEAGISVPSGGTGILITAGSVALRGLTLEGAGAGQDGVTITGGSRLEIVDCVIRDFTHDGIYVNPSTGTMSLSISNTIASDNTNAGIDIGPAVGNATVSGILSQILTNNNAGDGIIVYGLNGASTLDIAVAGGASDSNHNNGVGIFGRGGGDTEVEIVGLTISHNTSYGIENNGGFLTLSQARLFRNNSFLTGGARFDLNNENLGQLTMDNNTMFDLRNAGVIFTDGTSNISGVISSNTGGTVQKQVPQ